LAEVKQKKTTGACVNASQIDNILTITVVTRRELLSAVPRRLRSISSAVSTT